MIDPLTKAYCNLNGVLRCLPALCRLDPTAAEIIRKRNLTMRFSVRNGPAARLIFAGGACRFEEGPGKCQIHLRFSGAKHFNDMMDGRANPGIAKGFTRIGFLTGDFVRLTKRLEYYLRPSPEALADADCRRINTMLTFLVAFAALAEVGMHDPVGAAVMRKAPNGVFTARVEGTDLAAHLRLSPGSIRLLDRPDGSPEVRFIFANLEKTYDILNNRVDFLTAIGMGDVRMEGYMPLMQTVEHILPMVSTYLA